MRWMMVGFIGWLSMAPVCAAMTACATQAKACCASGQAHCASQPEAPAGDAFPSVPNTAMAPGEVLPHLHPEVPVAAEIRPGDPDALAFDLPLYLKNHSLLN